MPATKRKTPEEIRAILAGVGQDVPEVPESDIPAELQNPTPAQVPVASDETERPTNEKIRKATAMNVDFRAQLSQILEEEETHPLRELIAMYKLKNEDGSYALPMKERVAIMKELLQYVGPKLKAVDIKKEIKSDMKITIVQFGQNSPEPRTLDVEE